MQYLIRNLRTLIRTKPFFKSYYLKSILRTKDGWNWFDFDVTAVVLILGMNESVQLHPYNSVMTDDSLSFIAP